MAFTVARRGLRRHGPLGPWPSSPPAGRLAASAGFPWTPKGMPARGERRPAPPVNGVRPLVVDDLLGRFATASNLTLLGRAEGASVVYKPTAGVRPLWDFAAETLAAREVLTYRVAQAMGVEVVPETRSGDGPLGPGVAQRFVDTGSRVRSSGPGDRADDALWPVAVLDLVANNADRKLGHLLGEVGTGRLWAIDHGLTFHPAAQAAHRPLGVRRPARPPPLVQALERSTPPSGRAWPARSTGTLGAARGRGAAAPGAAPCGAVPSTRSRLATATRSPGPRY